MAGIIHSNLLKQVESEEPVLDSDNDLIEAFKNGDQRAGYKLYVKHHKMILKVVLSITNGRWYDDDCLIAGTVGIYEAAKRFDPELGFAFLTYAVPWIKKYVYMEVCNAVLPAGGVSFTRNFKDRLYRYIGFKMIGLSDDEIKAKMMISDEILAEMSLAAYSTSRPLSLTMPADDVFGSDDATEEVPTPGMPTSASAEEVIVEKEMVENYIRLIDQIEDVRCRFLLKNALVINIDYAAELIEMEPIIGRKEQMKFLGITSLAQFNNVKRKAHRVLRKAIRAQERVEEDVDDD